MIYLACKIFRALPFRLRSIYDRLSIPHRIFIKEHVLIGSCHFNGRRYLEQKSLNYEEYFYKYKDAIEEAKKLAIEKGLDPNDLQSSVCSSCEIPMIWRGRDPRPKLLCLKCGHEC